MCQNINVTINFLILFYLVLFLSSCSTNFEKNRSRFESPNSETHICGVTRVLDNYTPMLTTMPMSGDIAWWP